MWRQISGQPSFSNILSKSENSASNIDQLSQYLVNNEGKIDLLLKDISSLVKTSNASFVDINKSANSFRELSSEFLLELKSGSFNLKELSNDSFEKLDKVLNSLDETLIQAEKLINNIEQSPSDLLFKQKSIKYGPGEIDEK